MERLISDYPSYEWWGPGWLVVLALLSYLYAKTFVMSDRYHVTKAKMTYFYGAIALTYFVKGSPFSLIADHYLFSAHVFQISVLLFVVTPLIILSLPTNFLRRCFWHYRIKKLLRLFAHPWMTAIFFNGFVTVYFVPSVFNTLQEHAVLLAAAQIILVIHAFFMWWTIITPLPEVSKLSDFVKVAYVFCTALLLMPIGFFLIVFGDAHYPLYNARAGELFPMMTAIYDQQLAGGILKAIQLSSYGVALFYLISNWARKEEEKDAYTEGDNRPVVQGAFPHLPNKK